jgi:hypothetical protein
LAWAYKTKRIELLKDEEKEDYRDAIFDWLKICVSSKKTYAFYFETRVLKGRDAQQHATLDRENCVRELICRDGGLDPFFFAPGTTALDQDGLLHLRFLIDWFIRRYDLDTARWLYRQLRQQKQRQGSPPALGGQIKAEASTPEGLAPQGGFFPFLVLLLATLVVALGGPLRPSLYGFLIFLILVGLVGGLLWLGRDPLAASGLRLFVPRLAGCIVVGYLPLVVGVETWQFIGELAQSRGEWRLVVMIILAILVAYGYLVLEMHSLIGQNRELWRRRLWSRALKIYILGLAWSLVIGLIILDILAPTFKKIDEGKFLPESQISWVPGFLGEIPWEILIGYVPLALLIGIFLQIFWEEKPITEPL